VKQEKLKLFGWFVLMLVALGGCSSTGANSDYYRESRVHDRRDPGFMRK